MRKYSFGQVNASSFDEGLFCRNEPQATHEMTECGNCCLCYPRYNVQRRGQPVVEFGRLQRHRFVNQYEAILNCPAVKAFSGRK